MLEHWLSGRGAAQEKRGLQEKKSTSGWTDSQMEKWSGWRSRRGAQCDWVQTATEVKAAMVKPEGNKGEDNNEDSSPSSNGGKEVAHTIGSSDSDDKPVRTDQSTG